MITIQPAVRLKNNKDYFLEISVVEPGVTLKLDGGVWMTFDDESISKRQYLPAPVFRLTTSTPFQVSFIPTQAGSLAEVEINRAVDLLNTSDDKVLTATIIDPTRNNEVLTTGRSVGDFNAILDPRGEGVRISLNDPVNLLPGTLYTLNLSLEGDSGALGFYNKAAAIESTWDDALPLGMHNYNLFSYDTGLYGNIRNLELYFDDTPAKKDTIFNTLDQTDAIFISSNRQWGTTVRVEERYPLTKEYYRALLGCPVGEDILNCYQNAKPGMYMGELGFELTAVFQSDPTIAGVAINDQAAEEAFTVYDHPKVLIFEKTANYDPNAVRALLDQVDLSKAVHKTPRQASSFSSNLMLNDEQRALQTAGGTFSEIFPTGWALNSNPWLAAVVWYLAIFILGVIAYPIVRVAFGGLTDRGYPFSRLTGLILAAYFTWLASSTFFQFNRLTIGIVLGCLVIVSGFLAYRQRKELAIELKSRMKYFLTVELVMLVLFALSLGIRYGNPDLWHPWKGGEKPMDLSYFTAVLKSSIFPPYDPWYAGGYINYYYYGFVLVGVPVKLLGIQPALAYNLVIPTLFSLTGLGAFSVGWNLFARKTLQGDDDAGKKANTLRANLAGLLSVFTVLIMGNLGTLRMFWQGLQRLIAPGGVIDNATIFQRFGWFFQGLVKFFTGTRINYGYGDWYWIPSRALPGDTITEFPFFTFTYADLHAHMIALPVTLLVIGWGLSLLLGKWKWPQFANLKPWISFSISLLIGALAIGMLRATNTWDFPTYLLLSALIVLFTTWRYADLPEKWLPGKPTWMRKALYAVGVIGLLVAGASLLFKPFTENFGQAYNSISLWSGDRSPLASYLVHWGLQFFLIITWFVWETRDWLASTPVSSLKKIQPYLGYLQVVAVLLGLVLLLITLLGVKIGWLAGILGVWALILMLRPGQADVKRLVLFMVGTGVVLTLFVEMFVLVGDIGRMNTVFKFYYQAWTFFGLSAAAALVWLLPAVTTRWKDAVSSIWQVTLAVLVFSAAMYPITAATDKIRDRMSQETPATLDGLKFMETSRYYDQNLDMDLSQDYHAIQWMQQNVQGSPVLVETNTVEYRWGNRFTIYTGLPGVLGWNWHQRQQRGFLDYNGIANRLSEIPMFYQTLDIEIARDFLDKYDVKYIILGQMERAYYPGDGLIKFEEYNGVYWREVFREADTVIYEVTE
jgi:YYY domain-containing protein